MGPMGAGKSTIGRLLSERLGRRSLDSDEQIQETHGYSPRVIASREGVASLHEVEARMLRAALAGTDPRVIAAAASTGDLPDIADLLSAPDVGAVLLEGDLGVMIDRAAGGRHRRSLDATEYQDLARRRHERLLPLADLVVDTTSQSVAVAADAVIAHWAVGLDRSRE